MSSYVNIYTDIQTESSPTSDSKRQIQYHQPSVHSSTKTTNNTKYKPGSSVATQAINSNVLMWAGFLTVSMVIYFMLSGGDFSFLMTYGGLARLFGFGILNYKIFTSQQVTGISIKTLQLYTTVFFFRLISIMMHEGYLPYDKSGDWLYHFVEGTSLVLASVALFATMFSFRHTYQGTLDSFGDDTGVMSMAAIIFFISIFIHPTLNKDLISDVAWTFAMYLESAALIPQLYMFQNQSRKASVSGGGIDQLMAHFVFALGFGRIMELLFWIYHHHELTNTSGSCLPGYLAVVSQLIQIGLMLKFFRSYYFSMKYSTPMTLPTSHAVMSIV